MTNSNISFPFASNEYARLREVREVVGLGTGIDEFLQPIAESAAGIFGTPTAVVSVVESDHQWFLAKTGIELDTTPRDYSICSRAIMTDQPLILPDTLAHPEFSTHPAVILEPYVRFYAGAPIVLSSGFRVGSVCAMDVSPHDAPSEDAVQQLRDLAAQVATHLESQHASRSDGNQTVRHQIASDAQQEFMALIGHEFRSPLTVLLGNAKLLRANISGEVQMDPGKREEFTGRALAAVISSGEHLHKLVERVIHFTNLQSGELFLCEENISCRDFLETVVAPIEPMITASQREVVSRCSNDISTIRGDGEQLLVAVSSLVANAALHGEGNIELTASRAEDQTFRLTCYDQGSGLAEEQIERSNRPFAIGGDVDTRHVSGLGLGLPLAKKIAELHGGTLQSGKNKLNSWVEMVLPVWRCSPPLH